MLAFYRKSSTVTPLKLSMALRPSIFWGEHEDDVEVWLDNFESCAKSNGWPRYNWPRLAYLYLSDTWQSWFSAHPHLANGKWRVFRREFSRAVGPPNRHHLLLNTWRQFTRKPEESAYAHAHRFYSYLLFQLAEPSRSEFLDRYLVVIYRKTRAVVDDVGSELGKAVFCAFVADDIAHLARPEPGPSRESNSNQSNNNNNNNRECVVIGATSDIHNGNITNQATGNASSTRELASQLLVDPVRTISSPSSLSSAPSSHFTANVTSMSQSLSNPLHCTTSLNRTRVAGRQRMQRRYEERIQELIQDFDDLACQFARFRPQRSIYSRNRRPSTINIQHDSSSESFDNNGNTDDSISNQAQSHRRQSYSCDNISVMTTATTYAFVTCFNCGLSGHLKNHCKLPKRTAPALLEAIARACR